MNKAKILMVDDNKEIREVVNILLSGEGYEVDEAGDGQKAIECTKQKKYDLIILDVMMPGLNGYQVCRVIREKTNVPILFLSARSQVEDKTMGLLSGGDDYLPKPFSYNELVSRVKALIRRYQVYKGKEEPVKESGLHIRNLELLEKEERVLKDGKEIELTDLEYAILLKLVKHRKQVFSADELYEAVWQEPYYAGASNTVMVHIRNLRNKIEEDPKKPLVIRTVWGKGYRCD